MARSEKEIADALELHKAIRTNGLGRAIALMDPVQVAAARRLICHALEDMIAPKVTAGEPLTNCHDADRTAKYWSDLERANARSS